MYRKDELLVKRGKVSGRGAGAGTGKREVCDRIYDYDVYNDLGEPDKDKDLARPVLGGKDHPYPRRCRTGRPHTKEDPLTESRQGEIFFYVPRDEAFSEVKGTSFALKGLYSVLHGLIPLLEKKLGEKEPGFPYFTAIDKLFNEGADLGEEFKDRLLDLVPGLKKFSTVEGIVKSILLFETPELLDKDKFSWMKDGEFGRQTLAGLNPCSIRLVKEWPLKSDLDPVKYGPPESAITKEVVEQQIFMTVEEAISQKKLFILDYHDLLLPYVHKVRDLKGTTLYGSRTLFFLTPINILKPIAIELVRPQGRGKPQWKRVYRPGWDSTTDWLWKLAKAHVQAHDSGYHQLVSHWLRTHCATEPYIIATNRQLSAMHPIYRLLHPHFGYTMEINSLARSVLINAGGSIERAFSLASTLWSIALSLTTSCGASIRKDCQQTSLADEIHAAEFDGMDQTQQAQDNEAQDMTDDHDELREEEIADQVDMEETEIEDLYTLNKLRRSRREIREPTWMKGYVKGKKGNI